MARRTSPTRNGRVDKRDGFKPDHPPRTATGRTIGRPTNLTENTRDTIVGNLHAGNSVQATCGLAGVPVASFYRWMRRGEDAQNYLDEHGQIPEEEERFRSFREEVIDARAQAEARAVGIVMEAMRGGFVTSEEPLLNIDGQPLRDDDGRILYKRTFTAPDGRLALSYLQRARPQDWNTKQTIDMAISGGEGGPVEVQVSHTVEQVQTLSERLMAVRGQFEEEDREDGEDDDVVDGELVD